MKKLASLSLALLLALCLASAALAEPVITEPEMPLTDTPVTYTAMIVTHALDTGDPNEKAVYVARGNDGRQHRMDRGAQHVQGRAHRHDLCLGRSAGFVR